MVDNTAGNGANNASNPAIHFGRQVRKARRERGWTVHDLARETGLTAGHISNIENGKRNPTDRLAQVFDRVFPARAGWFGDYYRDSKEWAPPGYRPWHETENDAANLRIWSPGILHGVVQTEAYARALFETFPGVTPEMIEARVQARLERQKRVLHRDSPPFVWVGVDELSLYRLVGSPLVMTAQMEHLLAVAALPRVTMQVLPAVAHPVNASELIVADGAAYAEHVWQGFTYTDEDTVTSLTRRITTIQAECYRASESIQLIGRMREAWNRGESPLTVTPTEGPASR